MAKAHIFKIKDKNRFRKIYNYIRRKPQNEFASDLSFKMISGEVDFSNTSGPITFTYTTSDPSITFTSAPTVTATSVDNLSNNSANVNIFITSVSTTQVVFESSAPFTGKVNFQIVSQD